MDAQSKKNNIIQWIQSLQDQRLLAVLQNIAESHQDKDWSNDLSDGEKASILQGHQEYIDGKGIPDAEARAILKSRLGF